MTDEPQARNGFEKLMFAFYRAIDSPVTWFRERIVEPNRPESYYYHRKIRRVPTADECYVEDRVCLYEAEQQFKRDKNVDSEILSILRSRKEDCILYEGIENKEKCKELREAYEDATDNWFIKYGELGYYGTAVDAYMKQKHRLIWERRHGNKLYKNHEDNKSDKNGNNV